jgi:hypothetical protein
MMDSEHTIHEVTYQPEHFGLFPQIRARCSCGETWTHGENVTEELKLSIFKSHLAYALRQATRID